MTEPKEEPTVMEAIENAIEFMEAAVTPCDEWVLLDLRIVARKLRREAVGRERITEKARHTEVPIGKRILALDKRGQDLLAETDKRSGR